MIVRTLSHGDEVLREHRKNRACETGNPALHRLQPNRTILCEHRTIMRPLKKQSPTGVSLCFICAATFYLQRSWPSSFSMLRHWLESLSEVFLHPPLAFWHLAFSVLPSLRMFWQVCR